LIGGLAGCLEDKRQAGKVDHPLKELLAQRVFSIDCGYPDANDSARLGADPVHKMLLDRDPVTGLDPSASRSSSFPIPSRAHRSPAASCLSPAHCMADPEAMRIKQAVSGRALPALTRDRDMRDGGTRVLSPDSAAGSPCLDEMARGGAAQPTCLVRQTPVSR
jgi:hypothetical protein